MSLVIKASDFPTQNWLVVIIETVGLHESFDKHRVDQIQILRKSQLTVEVNSLDARMYGTEMLELVTFCYTYGLKIHLKGDVKLFMDYLRDLLISKRDFSLDCAAGTVSELLVHTFLTT